MILQFLTGLKCRVTTDDGAPGVGFKLYTFRGGTFDTNLATYSDSAGESANTNPVVFDDRGEASIALLPQAYNFILNTASDVFVESIPNFFLGSAQSATIVDTVAAMRALPTGSASLVFTLGYTTADDGCGQAYDFDPSSSETENQVTVFTPISVPDNGRYLLRYTGVLDARAAGIIGNSQDVVAKMVTLALMAGGREVYFSPGQYNFQEDLAISNMVLDIDDNARFSVGSGKTLTIPQFKHGIAPLFIGAGDVFITGPMREVYPEWFGATDRADTFNNVSAIQKTFASCSTTQPVTFPGSSGYNCTTNPSIPLDSQCIFNASNIYKQSTGDVYLARGLHLPTNESLISGAFAYFYGDGHFGGNVDVGGALAVTGDFSTLGTFSAAALASLSGDVHSAQDVTAARDISATHDVISGRNVTATSGTVSGSSLTATNAVTAASYRLTGRPETLGVYNSIFSGDITLAFQAGTPSNIVKRASYVIPAGNTVIVQFYVEFDLSATATKLTITFANTGFSFQSILDAGFTSVSIGSAIKSGYSVATAAHAIDVFIDGGFANATGQILRGNIICEAIAP